MSSFCDRWRLNYFDSKSSPQPLQLLKVGEDDVEEELLNKLRSIKGVENFEKKVRKRRKRNESDITTNSLKKTKESANRA